MSGGRRCFGTFLILGGAAAGALYLWRRPWQTAAPRIPVYAGNLATHVFHRAGCRLYHSHPDDPEFFERNSAVEAGFRPCGVCKP